MNTLLYVRTNGQFNCHKLIWVFSIFNFSNLPNQTKLFPNDQIFFMGIQSRTSGLQVHYSIHSTTQICNFAIRQGRLNFEKLRMCSKLGLNNNLKSLKLKTAVDKIMKMPRFLTRGTSSLFTFYCHRTDLENPFLTMIRITMTRTWGSRTPGVKTQRYNDKLQNVIFVLRNLRATSHRSKEKKIREKKKKTSKDIFVFASTFDQYQWALTKSQPSTKVLGHIYTDGCERERESGSAFAWRTV